MPNMSFERNDKLIDLTKTSYDELCEIASKFPSALDPELLKETDKYIKSKLTDKNIANIKVKEDFKIGEMTFKNPKIKKLSENVKRKRIELYMAFNQFFLNLMPFISLDDKLSVGVLSRQFMAVKSMILFSMKNKALQSKIDELPTESGGYVEIRRRKAQRFREAG